MPIGASRVRQAREAPGVHRLERRRRVEDRGCEDLPRLVRRELEGPRRGCRAVPQIVARGEGGRQLVAAQPLRDRALVEYRYAAALRRRRKHHAAAVELEAVAAAARAGDAGQAAAGVQELGRRIDLERTRGEKERGASRLTGRVAQPVAQQEKRAAALGHGERGRLQAQVAGRPGDGRNRQIAVGEALLRRDVGPAPETSAGGEKRLERRRAHAQLAGGVFGHQRLALAAVQADHRPIDLLARESARIRAARGFACHRLDQRIRRFAEGERLDDQLGEPGRIAVRRHGQADEARFLLRQGEIVATAAGARHVAHRPVARAVGGQLDGEGTRLAARQPEEREAAELATRAEVDGPGDAAPARPPGGRAIAVERRRGGMARQRGGGARRRRAGVRRIRRQLLEREAAQPHRAAAAGAGGDRQFERTETRDLAAVGGSPGEVRLALLHPHRRPLAGKRVVAPHRPPDAFARRIDELDFEMVARRRAAQLEGEHPVGRQIEPERQPRRRPTAAAVKIEIEPQRLVVPRHLELDAVGGRGDPGKLRPNSSLGCGRRETSA